MKACFLLMALLLIGGCASSTTVPQSPAVNSVYKHVAYPHSEKELLDAYLAAVQEMDLVVVTTSPNRIEAQSTKTQLPTNVVIEISPADTLATSVRITSAYLMRGQEYIHYPYELSYKASKHLDTAKEDAYVYPQAVYPAGIAECPAPEVENWDQVKGPQLIGGLAGLAERLSYTHEARMAGIEGRIYVEAVVNENGEVTCAEIDTGLPAGLNKKALEAVVESRFEPARFRNDPITVKISLPVTFRFRR